MVMVYAGGHISGGHYNPAVTLAASVRGRHPWTELVPYWIAQIVGAFLAAGAAMYLTGGVTNSATPPIDIFKALLAEFLFSFALAYVVLNVATAKATSGNSFYGLAIGFTVLTGAFAVGSISGGAFNPAVAIGASVMGLIHLPSVWIHIFGDLAGGFGCRFDVPISKSRRQVRRYSDQVRATNRGVAIQAFFFCTLVSRCGARWWIVISAAFSSNPSHPRGKRPLNTVLCANYT